MGHLPLQLKLAAATTAARAALPASKSPAPATASEAEPFLSTSSGLSSQTLRRNDAPRGTDVEQGARKAKSLRQRLT